MSLPSPSDDPIILRSHLAFLDNGNESLEDFIFQTVRAALSRWKVSLAEVDGIVTASSDGLDGRAISIMVTGASAGVYKKDAINLSSASEHALFYQVARVRSGRTKLGLVVAWGKPSEVALHQIDRISDDPFFMRTVPHDREANREMQRRAFLAQTGLSDEDLRPLAGTYAGEVTLADCCIVMLVGPPAAARYSDFPISVRGMGVAVQSYWPDENLLRRWPSLQKASTDAAKRAQLTSLRDEIDIFELSSLTQVQELIAVLELGLATESELAAYVRSRAAGEIAVNPSGGLCKSYPDFGSGLLVVAHACEGLRAVTPRPGRPARALAHGLSGDPAQSHSVFILEAANA
ncbi:hypothetical protein EPN44_10420 [bacterium]|nr:MAG: hypothetical protein EPN44_10420 [bacterium]